jgi:hypothetical protein
LVSEKDHAGELEESDRRTGWSAAFRSNPGVIASYLGDREVITGEQRKTQRVSREGNQTRDMAFAEQGT